MLRSIPIVLGLLAMMVSCPSSIAAEDEAFFAYGRFDSAIYAVHTIERPKAAGDITLFRLTFDEQVDEPSRADMYSRKDFNTHPQAASAFTPMASIRLTPGGAMPILTDSYRQKLPLAILAHKLIDQRPFLFPVFERNGMTLRKGQTWTYDAPPFVLLDSTFKRLIENEGKIIGDVGPATQITSKWTGWEEVNGYQCAVIEFSFKVTPRKGVGQPEEEGEYSLSGTCWFSPEAGLPVVTMLKADGYVVSNKTPRRTFSLIRKEVLVHVDRNSEINLAPAEEDSGKSKVHESSDIANIEPDAHKNADNEMNRDATRNVSARIPVADRLSVEQTAPKSPEQSGWRTYILGAGAVLVFAAIGSWLLFGPRRRD